MNKIVSVILGLLIVSILVIVGLLVSKKVLHISDSARLWEFWCIYGFTLILFISQWVCYKSYVELRNSKGVRGKRGKEGKIGGTGFEGKCIWR